MQGKGSLVKSFSAETSSVGSDAVSISCGKVHVLEMARITLQAPQAGKHVI